MCKANLRSGLQVDACKVYQQSEGSGWQNLSLEDSVGILERTPELPSIQNLICVLQKCRKRKHLAYAKRVHSHICNNGWEAQRAVGNYIVPMFVECGSVFDAQQVFDRLVHQTEHSWTSLILGYIQCGQLQHALNLFQKMQEDGVHPSSFTLVPLLKACATLKDMERGQQIHVEIAQKGFEKDIFVSSTLISMYAKCGSLSEAQKIFDKLPDRNVVSWTALIAGYAEHGPGQEVLKCFRKMRVEGVSPNAVTFVCVLKAYGTSGAIDKGRDLHSEIAQRGFESNLFVGSTLVGMYAKSGSLSEAQQLFDKLLGHDVVSWNALIAGYAEHGSGQKALKCFEQMQLEEVSPDAGTYSCILKVCGRIGAIGKGREIEKQISQVGYEKDISVGSTLVSMYAKCDSISEAQEAFNKLLVREVVSWNALIGGYAEHGSDEALKCFEQMKLEGVSPDAVTFVCVLKSVGSIGALDKGFKMHTEIIRKGFETDPVVGSTLVGMYGKCGSLSEAQEVFAKLPAKDVVSWNALIAGYADYGPGKEGLNCFKQMQLEGVSPDAATLACVLKTCGSAGAIGKGREIHSEIILKGFERDLSVGNSLLDMYAKCGSISEALEVFDKLPVRDVVSWSALIAGYAMNCEDNSSLRCFEEMQVEGVQPNAVTFTCVLTACSHGSLLFEGQEYFKLMREEFAIVPTTDHYTCMIDLLARSGHLYEAEKFLETMPCPVSKETWRALLSSCKTYGDAELGLRCFQQLIQMHPKDAASYMLMVGISANSGR